MKRFYTVLCLGMLVTGCGEYPDTRPLPPPPPPKKLVIGKDAPIENRFSSGDIIFGSGSVTKSQTVYYIVGEDGTLCEVDLGVYARIKIGDSCECQNWKTAQ